MPYIALANCYGVSAYDTIPRATPINDNDYSYHITAVALV